MVYTFDQEKKGIAVVIGNEYPELQGSQLRGAIQDGKMMANLFESLKFNVRFYNDLDSKDIIEKILTVANEKPDCFALGFSGHGGMLKDSMSSQAGMIVWRHVIYGNNMDDGVVYVEEILKELKECKNLQGKPKLLFFDVCRTKQTEGLESQDVYDPGLKLKTSSAGETSDGTNLAKDMSTEIWDDTNIDCPEDTLIMYPVAPGKAAMSWPKTGSWLISKLHGNLHMLKDGESLTVYLTKICQEIANMEVTVNVDKGTELGPLERFLSSSIAYVSKMDKRTDLMKLIRGSFFNITMETTESSVKDQLIEYFKPDLDTWDETKKQLFREIIEIASPFKTMAVVMHRLTDNIVFFPK